MAKKIAFIYGMGGLPSPYNDMGFKGVELCKTNFGVEIEIRLPQREDEVPKFLEEFASRKMYELVFAMGFAAGKPVTEASDKFPDQKFAVLDSEVKRPNVASYIAKQLDISFLAGAVAAEFSKTGTVGSVFGMDDDLMRRWIAGYTTGAMYVNPSVNVLYSFVGSWSDPDKAEELSVAQYGKGADVIMAHASAADPGIIRAAQKRNKYVIGFGGERPTAPNNVLFDILRHAEVCVVDAIERTVKGDFKAGTFVFGIAEGNWALTLETAHALVTDSIKQKAEAVKKDIASGKATLPTDIQSSIAKATKVG